MAQKELSVYIHIPFCKKICSYCAFTKFLYNEDWAKQYIKMLSNEIRDRYMDDYIKTIYIGGGTPSSLSLPLIKELLSLIYQFKLDKLQEFTFECNIEDINADLLKLLKEYKVNRLSIGIESFNKENLSLLNRKCSYKDVKEKIKLIRNMGFNNINLDLIYAIPDETLKIFKKDLFYLRKLNVEHISTYSLMIEDNTILKNNNVNTINEDLDAEMYDYLCNYLKRWGYNHYEISNFAKKGFESKHNMVYWNNEEYYGFGCGAAGYIESIRYENTKNLNKYLNGEFNSKDELVNLKTKMNYELILGLRKTKGINLQEFYKKYNTNLQDEYPIKPLLLNKDLIYKNGYIYINPKKLYIMNEILLKLV